MNIDELKKVLFVLEMAKNKLKDDEKFQEYNAEVRQYIMKYLLENRGMKR